LKPVSFKRLAATLTALVLFSTFGPTNASAQGASTGASSEQSLRVLEKRIAEWDSFGWPKKGRFTVSQRALDSYVEFNKRLWNDYGITYMFAPTLMGQWGTHPGRNFTANYQHNILIFWRVFEESVIGSGSFVFNALQIRQLTKTTGVTFAGAAGINFFTSDSPADSDTIKAIYWRQDLPGGFANIRVGHVELSGIDGGCTYACDDTTSFISAPLAANPARTMPGQGMGIIAELIFGGGISVEAGVADGNGDGTVNAGRPFRTRELAYAAAIIARNPFPQLGAGHYRLSFYYVDPTKQGTPGAIAATRGFSIQADQDFGNYGVFARYTKTFGRLGAVSQTAAGGLVWNKPFGHDEDKLGAGFGWVAPTAAGTRNEYVAETFYRLQLTPLVSVTADAMLLINPSKAPKSNMSGVFTLRTRAHF